MLYPFHGDVMMLYPFHGDVMMLYPFKGLSLMLYPFHGEWKGYNIRDKPLKGLSLKRCYDVTLLYPVALRLIKG